MYLLIALLVLNLVHERIHVWQYTLGSTLSGRTGCSLNVSIQDINMFTNEPKIAIVSKIGRIVS